ncbi:hypothetical protein MNB_SV-13-550 [hydrothermal vent metagenome]|uniref:Initiator Rep protein WH1 domain-containing protein n=1 Tax=hydrothermal vent metagenome TaxID=652676 RepID=A0A1W1CYS7_9ZZZZ
MTLAEWNEKKAKEFGEKKQKPLQKISNNFIDNTINKNNINAIKTVFYLATVLDKFNFDLRLDRLKIDLNDMLKYTEMTRQEIRNNLKMMQETSITFINEKEEWEKYIVLIPQINISYGSNFITIDLYSKIAKLIVEVKNNYTYIDTRVLMSLKSKHSIRILPLLEKIKGYDAHVGKRKKMSLNALNDFFGTKYKRIADIERRVLKPAQKELDNSPTLTFIYQVHMESFGRGRPKATSVTIDLVIRPEYYLSSRKIFIEYLRQSFVGKNILETIDKHTHKRITIYISKKGRLYDRISGESFDAKRANEIWTSLYELAKDGKLGVLEE